MISTLSKYPKLIAVFLFELFFAQTALAGKLHGGIDPAFVGTGSEKTTFGQNTLGFSPYDAPAAIPLENKTGTFRSPKVTNAEKGRSGKKPAVGGPGQPEMSSFKSINSNNMVDLFTGDFSYNIPLMDVGGYPVNIHYNSGVSMDQEASWVGLGWNINPGVIGRTTRGLPDDFNGSDSIVRTQSIKENRTVGVTISANPEFKGRALSFSLGLGAFHNNYNGWGTESFVNVAVNAGKQVKGHLSGGLNIGNNSQSGLNFQPTLSYTIGKRDAEWNGAASIGTNYNSRSGISALQLNTEVRHNVTVKEIERDGKLIQLDNPIRESTSFGMPSSISFATPAYLPTVRMPMTSSQYSFKLKVGSEKLAWFSNASILGYVSASKIKEEDKRQTLPAYGYLYFSGNRSPRSLLDFNREKEVAFNEKTTPHIAIPQYTYDTYSISGEGITGSFRPYRGDVGYIYDHSVSTKSESSKFSAELGFGQYFHAGVDFDNITAVTQTGAWEQNNDILKNLKFLKSDSTFEEVYFRNPGEKTTNTSAFYSQLGGDSLVSVKLTGQKASIKAESILTRYSQTLKPAGETAVTNPLFRQKRDKRSQLITYLNAGDASKIGLDTVIRSYPENSNPLLHCGNYSEIKRVGGIRKNHHLSEIDVLNPDGRRYIYGLPAYNIAEEDVVFSVDAKKDPIDLGKGLVSYTSGENSKENGSGKENYYTKDSIPAHAHSFLLTGILSPDYVDIKGDGITEDDLGDGVKFNYTQVYGNLNNNPFNWRTPYSSNTATYNEGLKTYSRDDKGTYLFGKKEVWYLNSIESKTMIAVFRISNRYDAFSVKSQNGDLDTLNPLRRLDSIELYAKADLLKNGERAKPIKTVHFEYETDPAAQLCKGIVASVNPAAGKLTLKKIWFTYNKNNKGKKNPYVFYYHPAGQQNIPVDSLNPAYNPKSYDRWGNYKDPASNPGGLSNLDFPYALQDSAKAAANASVWNLTDVKLPSGGRIKVTYESDDYGFVQNKRAVQMVAIAGFGASKVVTPSNRLYNDVNSDNDIVFIDSKTPLADAKDVYRLYLQGLEDRDGKLKIYIKMAVKMPYENDTWSTASKYEMVPTYAEVEQYGIVGNPGSTRFWLKLKRVNNAGVLAKAALQFLRLNLPSKAYPGSEIGDNVSVVQVVKTLATAFKELKNAVDGFEDQQKRQHHCEIVELDKSYIRLGNPAYKKYGGGLRVKRIEISDNWNAMTGQKESVYGQEYAYTTAFVRGQNDTISISSGVAAYEPMIGGEENAFHLPVEYTEQLAALAPTNFLYTETPLGESFFPAPMVGYSKVRVRTINAKARSANGWTETEYYTTRDFPTLVDNTPIDKRSYNPKFNILKVNAIHHLTVSQGFRIELNDMNGKTKAEAIYAENDSLRPIHYTANFYKVENDLAFTKRLSNTVWAVDSSSGHINKQAQIGKEIEVMVDVREQKSNTLSNNLGVNADFVPFPFIPGFLLLPSRVPLPQREESRFRSIAVTKIIQRYGILDSIVVIDKGSVVTTKNLVFDAETGGPLITRTNNEYNEPVYNLSYPARWAYSGMGMAYENMGLLLRDKKLKNGKLVERDESRSPAIKYFESGDEVWLLKAQTGVVSSNTATACGTMTTTGPEKNTVKKLWAIDASKGKKPDQGIYFIDEKGKPYTGSVEEMRIIRSGKRNFTDAFVGSVTSLLNPVQDRSATEGQIVVDASTKVLNATTATFKDLWRVENSLYQTDSCYSVTRDKVAFLSPTTLPLKLEINPTHKSILYDGHGTDTSVIVASYDYVSDANSFMGRDFRTKGIISYDLYSIPANATITSATIGLWLLEHGNLWNYEEYSWKCGFLGTSTCHAYHYDWANDHRAYGGTYNSVIRRIQTPWNRNTKYLDFGVSSQNQLTVNTVPASGNSYLPLSCTELVKDVVERKLPYYGFMFELQDPGQTIGVPHFYSLAGSASEMGGPFLTVNYRVQQDTCVKICRNNITDTTNPYRWGLLGNWRVDRTIVYYAGRSESDAAITQTNIRKEGVLNDFTPYWSFTNTALKATTDTMHWVWNSTSSLYNRKGVEIENFDPLGRYNAGLYGYNHTMPIAVAQNSKYREVLYDGFEDYQYRTRYCDTACATPREIDFVTGRSAAAIDSTESHTGRYALRVTQNDSVTLAVPLTSLVTDSLMTTAGTDSLKTALSTNVDREYIYTTAVFGKGTGLTATYKCVTGFDAVQRTEGPLDFVYNSYAQPLPANCQGSDRYSAVWKGKIQPKYSEVYTFSVTTTAALFYSSGAGIVITDPATNSNVLVTNITAFGGTRSGITSVPLVAGKLYDITVSYPNFLKSFGQIHLKWSSNRQQMEIIPQANFYPVNMQPADSAGSVIQTIKDTCFRANAVVQHNGILPRFSPSAGKKIIIGAWMKVPANCGSGIVTAEGQISVWLNTGEQVSLEKTGWPIEGWQRYEALVVIPAAASGLELRLKAGASLVLVDDIRVQPYNSNMKAFVYDPVNLRLMSELDENNYASFYEYDDDGTLVRVKKETERGIQTIRETRSSLTKE